MTSTKDIIIKLKAVRDERNLSLNDILNLIEENGDMLSKASVQRVFADGSEDQSFKYEETLRPIANALLDINTIEDGDNNDEKAMKALLRYKSQRIDELERRIEDLELALNKEKVKSHEKLDKERERTSRSIEFLKVQIEKKDDRIDKLLQAVYSKDKAYTELLNQYLSCPYSHISEVKK